MSTSDSTRSIQDVGWDFFSIILISLLMIYAAFISQDAFHEFSGSRDMPFLVQAIKLKFPRREGNILDGGTSG